LTLVKHSDGWGYELSLTEDGDYFLGIPGESTNLSPESAVALAKRILELEEK
jgi:hypothetical protein